MYHIGQTLFIINPFKTNKFVRGFFVGLLILLFTPNWAQGHFDEKVRKRPSIFDIMYQKKILKVNLAFNVEEVISDRKNDDEHEALMTFKDKNGQFQNWVIKVNVRGVYRRFNCPEMPPLKLNFKKSELKNAGLSKFDDYKLVTHCIYDEDLARKLVLKEYLAYKYYNAITPESFRVQLLQINYVDVQTGIIQQQLAFLIEDFGELRNRIGANKIPKIFGVSSNQLENLNKEQFQLMSFFQYMIGNTDWGIESIRNVKLCEKDGKWLVIPYDFDFSGLVEAPYAMITPDYGERFIRDRTFLGFNPLEVKLDEANKRFLKKRKKLNRITRRLKLLPRKDRKNLKMYIDSFYEGLDYVYVKKSQMSGEENPTDNKDEEQNHN